MKNWKVSHRLMAAFGLVIAILLGMSIYSVFITNGIDEALSANADQNSVIQRAAINFRGSAHDRSIAVRDAVVAPDETTRKKEEATIDRLAAFYLQSGQTLEEALRGTGKVPAEVAPMLQAIKDVESRAVATTREVLKLVQTGDRAAAEALLWTQAKPQYEQWLAAINKLIDFEEERITSNTSVASKEADQFSKVMAAITLLAVLVSLSATLLVTRSIDRELGAEPHEVRSVVQAIEQGDLTVSVQIRSGDTSSVMVAVRDMQQRFHELVSAVRDNIQQLRATSDDISNGNQNLGNRTEQAASSLEQTAASM
ncbi:MAG: methyl-accepting chemotaxis protein, partial [Burkholderiaceae bacterium]|nr:methyl-accepting chemotaxis protein [Burkholderiaceae bacterium]